MQCNAVPYKATKQCFNSTPDQALCTEAGVILQASCQYPCTVKLDRLAATQRTMLSLSTTLYGTITNTAVDHQYMPTLPTMYDPSVVANH